MRLVAGTILLLAACGSRATARQVNGPDGSHDWWMIRCRSDHGACLERAGERCPGGYDVTPRPRADEEFSSEMLIRCRTRSAPVPAVSQDCKENPALPRCPEEERAAREAGVIRPAD